MFGGGVGEEFADVAQGGGAQKGVGDGVQQCVGIGVAEQAFAVGNGNAAQNQGAAFNEPVDVIALSDTDIHGVSLESESAGCFLIAQPNLLCGLNGGFIVQHAVLEMHQRAAAPADFLFALCF